VSYPHLFKANAFKGGEAKYSVTMLFPKTADLSALKLAIKHAKIDKWGPDKDEWPEDLMSPVQDGDNPKYAANEGYKGHWAIKASSKEAQKPGLVNEKVEPIIDASEFYPGCYARAQVFANGWEYMGKSGVSFILDHVQKTRDGKSFGGRKSAAEVFDPVSGGKAPSMDEELDEDEEDFA